MSEGLGRSSDHDLVVDASVVIKWHVPEAHSDAARRLIGERGPELHVPDFAFVELGNILWKKIRRGELTPEQGRQIARLLAVAPLETHPSAPLLQAAVEIAIRFDRSVYDSLYVALAVQLGGRLVTADERLVNALRSGPLGDSIIWIGDFDSLSAALGGAGAEGGNDFELAGHISPHAADEIELLYSYFTDDRLCDEHLIQSRSLPGLTNLSLRNPAITDAGLEFLPKHANLTALYLDGSGITDDGLVSLAALPKLETLVLRDTRITDEGLLHLMGIKSLKKLDLAGTSVTREGVERARRALPQVEITWVDGV